MIKRCGCLVAWLRPASAKDEPPDLRKTLFHEFLDREWLFRALSRSRIIGTFGQFQSDCLTCRSLILLTRAGGRLVRLTSKKRGRDNACPRAQAA